MAAVATPLELVKQFIANFERKQRNLAKRKSKLDAYRDKLARGDALKEEQKKAVDGYDGVLQTITAVQEFVTQSKELLDDIERSNKYEESQLDLAHERHTLSFLHTYACLTRLLNSLDINPVRMAVTKASSENHLKLLDVLRTLTTAPILDNWPGTSAAALSDAPSFLQKQPSLSAVAEHINSFVTGRPSPIPLPSGYDGPHKKFTYKDARVLCFRLLATPTVQRAMGLPSRPASVVSSVNEEHPADTLELEAEHPKPSVLTVDSAMKQIHVTPVRSTPTVSEQGTPEVTENMTTNIEMIDQVIKPLGGTFNFLQASKVGASDPMFIQSPVREDAQATIPVTNGIPDHSYFDSQSHSQTVEPTSMVAERCFTPVNQNKPVLSYDIQEDPHVEILPHQNGRDVPVEEDPDQVHHMEEEEEQSSASIPSKPVSYADLVRRQGYSRPLSQNQTTANDVRKQELYGEFHHDSEAAESHRDGYQSSPVGVSSNRGSMGRGGASRGRGQGDFRGGGRGGPNRGSYGGAPRRGAGGGRGGRYESGSGRGGAPYRGMSTGIPQSTY